MGFDNVNVNVSGPVQPTSTYKTKVLKGNHSFASQVTEPNIKYVIKHDFVLDGDVTIPENCILEFDGGSLSNGTVVGQNTYIQAGIEEIFGTRIVLDGSWNNIEVYSSWFSPNVSNVIEQLINLTNENDYNKIIINTNCLVTAYSEYRYCNELKSNTDFELNANIQLSPNNFIDYYIISINGKSNIHIYGNGSIIGDKKEHTGSDGEWGMGINMYDADNISISGISISECWGDGIYIGGGTKVCKNIKINNVRIYDCRRQGISVTYCDGFYFSELNIHDILGTSPECAVDIEPNRGQYVTNGTIERCFLQGVRGIDMLKTAGDDVSNISIIKCIIKSSTRRAIYTYDTNNILVDNCKISTTTENVAPLVTFYNLSTGTTFINNIIINNESESTCLNVANRNAFVYNNEIQGDIYVDSSNRTKESTISHNIISGVLRGSYFYAFNNNLDYGAEVSYVVLKDNNIHAKSAVVLSTNNQNYVVIARYCNLIENDIDYLGDETLTSYVWTTGECIIRNNKFGQNANSIVQCATENTVTIDNNETGLYTVFGKPFYTHFKTKRVGQNNEVPTLESALFNGNEFFNLTNIRPYWYIKGYGFIDCDGFHMASKKGTTRPTNELTSTDDTGYIFFDKGLNRHIWLERTSDSVIWREFDGATSGVKRSGTFQEKPHYSFIYVGFAYFCTDKQTAEGATDGIMIYHKGNNVWVDALGRVIS